MTQKYHDEWASVDSLSRIVTMLKQPVHIDDGVVSMHEATYRDLIMASGPSLIDHHPSLPPGNTIMGVPVVFDDSIPEGTIIWRAHRMIDLTKPDDRTRTPAQIVTATGWVPPWQADRYTIELSGTFMQTPERGGKALRIAQQTTVTREALDGRFDTDLPEYIRTKMGKMLARDVLQECGEIVSVGKPPRYVLVDDRDSKNPRTVELPWTWEQSS